MPRDFSLSDCDGCNFSPSPANGWRNKFASSNVWDICDRLIPLPDRAALTYYPLPRYQYLRSVTNYLSKASPSDDKYVTYYPLPRYQYLRSVTNYLSKASPSDDKYVCRIIYPRHLQLVTNGKCVWRIINPTHLHLTTKYYHLPRYQYLRPVTNYLSKASSSGKYVWWIIHPTLDIH